VKSFLMMSVLFTAGLVCLWYFMMLSLMDVPLWRTWPLLAFVGVAQFILGTQFHKVGSMVSAEYPNKAAGAAHEPLGYEASIDPTLKPKKPFPCKVYMALSQHGDLLPYAGVAYTEQHLRQEYAKRFTHTLKHINARVVRVEIHDDGA